MAFWGQFQQTLPKGWGGWCIINNSDVLYRLSLGGGEGDGIT